MGLIFTDQTEDDESANIVAAGPLLVTVTGVLGSAIVTVLAEIFTDGGYAVAYRHYNGDITSLQRLEFAVGVTYRVEITNASDDTEVTVAVLNV